VIRQCQPEKSPHGQRVGSRSQIEDRTQHRKICDKRGERHDADQRRVVQRFLAASSELSSDGQDQGNRHQHGHLNRSGPVTHVAR